MIIDFIFFVCDTLISKRQQMELLKIRKDLHQAQRGNICKLISFI